MDHRPTILCLHGAGTNSTIFALQAKPITQQLEQHFRFLYIDAPFESGPGPGVEPTFHGMRPYLWWHCDPSAAQQFDIDVPEVLRRRKVVRELLRRKMDEDGRVVGLMAFSQGARVAAGLCLDSELGRGIRLVICLSGTFPALGVSEDGEGFAGSSGDSTPRRLKIPSVHVHGRMDPWMHEGERLRKTYFDDDLAEVVYFQGGHAVPTATRDAQLVVKAVLKAKRDASSDHDQ